MSPHITAAPEYFSSSKIRNPKDAAIICNQLLRACRVPAVGCVVPVIVSVAQRPDGNFKSLPHRVQGILHHFCFVADGVAVRHIEVLRWQKKKKIKKKNIIIAQQCMPLFDNNCFFWGVFCRIQTGSLLPSCAAVIPCSGAFKSHQYKPSCSKENVLSVRRSSRLE